MTPEDGEFLRYVTEYVTAHPEVGAHVSDYVAKGIMRSRIEALERAADFEAALAMRLSAGYGDEARLFILKKLRDWNGRSALKWDWAIESLDRKL